VPFIVVAGYLLYCNMLLRPASRLVRMYYGLSGGERRGMLCCLPERLSLALSFVIVALSTESIRIYMETRARAHRRKSSRPLLPTFSFAKGYADASGPRKSLQFDTIPGVSGLHSGSSELEDVKVHLVHKYMMIVGGTTHVEPEAALRTVVEDVSELQELLDWVWDYYYPLGAELTPDERAGVSDELESWWRSRRGSGNVSASGGGDVVTLGDFIQWFDSVCRRIRDDELIATL
jgi:hypothetical protein